MWYPISMATLASLSDIRRINQEAYGSPEKVASSLTSWTLDLVDQAWKAELHLKGYFKQEAPASRGQSPAGYRMEEQRERSWCRPGEPWMVLEGGWKRR